MAQCGEMAANTPGLCSTSQSPSTPSTRNQAAQIGPNTAPIFAVPRYCTRKSATRITTEIGKTAFSKCGETTLSPSTAESTEMAGVMMPSPKNKQAPAMPISARAQRRRAFSTLRCASAISASTPPSPRLSARRMNTTYLTVTVRISDQMIRLKRPRISQASTPPSSKWLTAARMA